MEDIVVDLPEVLERVQDDKELLIELFDIFIQDYGVKYQKLKNALAAGNGEEIKEIVHSIKGAAGNISAMAVHATALKIEKMAASQDLTSIAAQLPQLDQQFENLKKRIKEIKQEFGV